ncbi:MAG: nucleotidyltransferase domain-containing protein [Prolixibacteraceae bacterium]|nr:nucleotidyltransferase domain-containing protein [Prolixibacteraceae bacterium]MBN2650392.1 nucleotidyltransferase domain-containing protein [Prolixibacteraceae bacterium]
MRLTHYQLENIKSLSKKHFGTQSSVFLFGSRTNDMKKGGDIDLFIRSNDKTQLTIEKKVHFLAELKAKIGNQHIDVVLDNDNTRQKENFYQSANQHKIRL